MVKYTWTAGVRMRRSLGAVLLVAADNEDVIVLESPGDAIWALLSSPSTVDDLVDELTLTFDAPRQVVTADVQRIVGELSDHRLVRATA